MRSILVLDMDGTLYAQNIYRKACKKAAENLKEYLKSKGRQDAMTMELFERIAKHGKVSSTVNMLHESSRLEKPGLLNAAYDLHPDDFGIGNDQRLVDYLNALKGRFRLFVFTNSPLIWAGRVLRELGVDQVVESSRWITFESLDGGAHIKPSKEAFELMLNKIGHRPGEIIFLDDSQECIETAQGLGIDARLICNDGHDHNVHSHSQSIYWELEQLIEGL